MCKLSQKEEFEDTTGVIRIRKSKNRKHNGKKKKYKGTKKNELQNTTQKTKDRVSRTPLNTGGKRRYSGRAKHEKKFICKRTTNQPFIGRLVYLKKITTSVFK
jgi:hypothetical protein